MKTDVAILAGGCFWGMQELIRKQDGVVRTEVGYTGGRSDKPTYHNHPGHAEALRIEFEPEKIQFTDLLLFFFQIHNPSTPGRQGNDIGSSYRSAIFYTSEDQKEQAGTLIDEMNKSGIWPGEIITEIEPASKFWMAEPEHQNYLQRNPHGYTCHFVRHEWVLPE
ncbi:TPA: peptide-methionine (S)-S-oxide reductase MsrA [Morganella morganii]